MKYTKTVGEFTWTIIQNPCGEGNFKWAGALLTKVDGNRPLLVGPTPEDVALDIANGDAESPAWQAFVNLLDLTDAQIKEKEGQLAALADLETWTRQD